jgi:hypothetical protein
MRSVVAIEETPSRPLTPAQRRYNAILQQIETQKATLAHWQQVHETCQQQVAGKYEPLREALTQEQIKLLFVFDDALTRHKFSKTQTNQLTQVILQWCEQLIETSDDASLLSLYQRYQPEAEPHVSPEDQAEMDAAMRAAFEDTFGFSLDEAVDINDAESIAQVLFEQQQTYQQETQRPRKKTAKQQAKEAHEKAEAEAAHQSIQSVYRQLVKALHPDRETNVDERTRKTLLMQAVTVAYEEKNLIKLLELQQQETRTSHQIHQLSEEKINSFIKLLETQWQQLKVETQQIENNYKQMLGMTPFDKLTPKKLQSYLKADIAHLEQKIKSVQQDRRLFERDSQALITWLKYQPCYDIGDE